MATKNGIAGREVYDRKRGLMGRVVKEDGLQITLEFNEGDEEVFKLWYSDDNQEFRLAIRAIAGVQYAFSDRVVLGTIAA